jgi:hypothetical protein
MKQLFTVAALLLLTAGCAKPDRHGSDFRAAEVPAVAAPVSQPKYVHRPILFEGFRFAVFTDQRVREIYCRRLLFNMAGDPPSSLGVRVRLENPSLLIAVFLRNEDHVPALVPKFSLIDDRGQLYAPTAIPEASDDLTQPHRLNPESTSIGALIFAAPDDPARGFALVIWPTGVGKPISIPIKPAEESRVRADQLTPVENSFLEQMADSIHRLTDDYGYVLGSRL